MGRSEGKEAPLPTGICFVTIARAPVHITHVYPWSALTGHSRTNANVELTPADIP
ncbi:hypothetical protein [Streptomyces sp. NPDC057280]|uniref:hypothetical protein n=1 Tax=Streptomyces sp. NPDC057280 TaxID=3346081 RepID=UPI00362BAC5B